MSSYEVIWHGTATTYGARGELLPPRDSHRYEQTIEEAIRVHGLAGEHYDRHRPLTPWQRTQARRWYAAGMALRDVAAKLKADREAVRTALRASKRMLGHAARVPRKRREES